MAKDMSWEKALGTPLPDKEKKRQHESKANLPNKRQLIIGATLLASLLSHAGGSYDELYRSLCSV